MRQIRFRCQFWVSSIVVSGRKNASNLSVPPRILVLIRQEKQEFVGTGGRIRRSPFRGLDLYLRSDILSCVASNKRHRQKRIPVMNRRKFLQGASLLAVSPSLPYKLFHIKPWAPSLTPHRFRSGWRSSKNRRIRAVHGFMPSGWKATSPRRASEPISKA